MYFSKSYESNMNSLMNHIYFEWYEFDVNVVSTLIATCTFKLKNNAVNTNEWISVQD